MKTTFYKANTRGYSNHGWLESYHTFSFAGYHNPERMHFGAMRVLNDDTVAGGRGFDTHRHENMEIISIPLSGDLEHRDSMGNQTVIQEGDIQVMSAGTGISHSEYNKNDRQEVQFLQIWIFANQQPVAPRYDQITIHHDQIKNTFKQILSPNKTDEGVWIYQDAWMHMGRIDQDKTITYDLKKKNNGIFIFVLEGQATINNQILDRRDAIGVWQVSNLDITVNTDAHLLVIEIPMSF